jgi:CheY-like chemotaxis protein
VSTNVNRATLARVAYAMALAAARAHSTSQTWRRLARAGQNLRDALRAPDAVEPVRRRAARPRVLLVEDDAATRDALRDILVHEGIEVCAARDGTHALALLRAHAARPSVIVVDLVLPGMSGWELCERLRAIPGLARVPVVAMSGRRDVSIAADRLFEKPFDPSELVEEVRRLGRKRVRRSPARPTRCCPRRGRAHNLQER